VRAGQTGETRELGRLQAGTPEGCSSVPGSRREQAEELRFPWAGAGHSASKPLLEALHERIETPPAGVTFVLCAEVLEDVPQRTREVLFPVEVRAPSVPVRRQLLERVAEREKTQAAEGALDLIARASRPSMRAVLQALEVLAAAGPITLEAVRRHFGFVDPSAVQRYVTAVAGGVAFGDQMAILDGWEVADRAKAQEIQSYFADLFSTDIMKLSRPETGVVLDRDSARDGVLTSLQVRAERHSLSLSRLVRDIIEFWHVTGDLTSADFLARVSRFDELLHGPAQYRQVDARVPAAVPILRRPMRARVAKAPAGRRRNRLASFLGREELAELWNAATFCVQVHGRCFTTRLTLRWDRLGLRGATAISGAVTGLLHELRMRVRERAPLAGEEEAFHYAYMHEAPDGELRRTHILLTLGPSDLQIGSWVVGRYLPRLLGSDPIPGAVRVRHRWSDDERERFEWHLTLLRLLSRGADPETGLTDALGIPRRLRDPPIGPKLTKRRPGIANTLGRQARDTFPSGDLPVLYPLSEGRLEELASGFELKEHGYRIAVIRDWEKVQHQFEVAWPVREGGLERESRRAELEGMRGQYARDVVTHRPGYVRRFG
jgi:hypothetical protein